ncbi:MAG TPA: hypothetical protein PKM71_09080, partial [Candidatus Cloacimonas sp.]|nr:hypothetical protein [Candidatus Cloacimonas sp.]
GLARLPVCGVLVLTHNFEKRIPVVAWMLVFSMCGMWIQICLWQNCKSKQAEVLKQKFAPKSLFLNNSNPALQPCKYEKKTFFHDCENCGVGLARLLVCGVLVLTHNFEVWRPFVVWM